MATIPHTPHTRAHRRGIESVTIAPMPDRLRSAGRIRTAAAAVALAWALSGPNTCAEQGLASWYGKSFHGKLAASGETYDAGALTAAHRTLPFGTNRSEERRVG